MQFEQRIRGAVVSIFDIILALSIRAWAQRIPGGDWFGSDVFYQAPLYPYFIGALYSIAGRDLMAVRLAQAVIGAGCPAFRLFARRASNRRPTDDRGRRSGC